MRQHSASSTHGTTTIRQRDRWEMIRLLGGSLSLLVALGGIIALGILAAHHDETASTAEIAIAMTATLGGLLGAKAAFGAQKAADRAGALDDRLDDEEGHLELLFAAVRTNRDEVRAVRDEARQDRRERVAVLAQLAEDVAEVRAMLTELGQGTNTLARAVREAADRQSAEASGFEVRLDALTRQHAAANEMLAKISLDMARQDEAAAELRQELLEQVREEVTKQLKADREARRANPPRGRRQARRKDGQPAASNNVVPIRARRAADALRRLTDHIEGETDA